MHAISSSQKSDQGNHAVESGIDIQPIDYAESAPDRIGGSAIVVGPATDRCGDRKFRSEDGDAIAGVLSSHQSGAIQGTENRMVGPPHVW